MAALARLVASVKKQLAGDSYRTVQAVEYVRRPSRRPVVRNDFNRDAIAEISVSGFSHGHMNVVILLTLFLAIDTLTLADIGVVGVENERR